MRGSRGIRHFPRTFTYVGRFVVEKNSSGSTPSEGAGVKRASGAERRAAASKSGCGMRRTREKYALEHGDRVAVNSDAQLSYSGWREPLGEKAKHARECRS